ncbi:MAG: DNA repair protein RecO [Bacteroidales bacterium]|jgi:DNA repair protein RecO (recombination protein O)|nr:DNA repair protein RecO [Bacteroidales bacterium]
MSVKTEAIVLNKIKYGDSSFIVNLYSLEYGRFATIIKIPKNKKNNNSVNRNLFFPLNIIETEVELKNTRNVQTVKYCGRKMVLNFIANDIFKSCIAQFIAEVILKTVKEEEPHENLYMFFKETISLLEKTENSSAVHLLFLKEFAKISGFGMTNNFCKETPYFNYVEGMFLPVFTYNEMSLEIPESKVLSGLLELSYDNLEEFKISYILRKRILEIFLRYYELHILGKHEIKSLKILNEVFG